MRKQVAFLALLFTSVSFFSCYTYDKMMDDLFVNHTIDKASRYTYEGSHGSIERSYVVSEIPTLKMTPQNIAIKIGNGKGKGVSDWEEDFRVAREIMESHLKVIDPVSCCPSQCGVQIGIPWTVPPNMNPRIFIVNDTYKTKSIISANIRHKASGNSFEARINPVDVTFEDFHSGNPKVQDGNYDVIINMRDNKTGSTAQLRFEQLFKK